MKQTKPKVFLIAGQQQLSGFDEWLTHLGLSFGRNDAITPFSINRYASGEPSEALVEAAARRCYNSFAPGLNPNVTQIRESRQEYLDNILKSAHGSVLEHGYSTWAFEDVSRVFTHEIVRNRAGLAYSQESLRYVRLGELKFWLPPEIATHPGEHPEDATARDIFIDLIDHCEQAQKLLAAAFDIDNQSFDVKKQLTSAMRRVAPMGLATGIVISFNMRALRWVIEQRTSPAAEIEMRTVFYQVGKLAIETWPLLFQDFQSKHNDSGPKSWIPKYSKV